MMILNFCKVIPDGIVCFFTSFDYLKFVLQFWTNETRIIDDLEKIKQVKKRI
jgi:Rad3-related DNA helicase